jgi:hypothetical protein
MKLHESRSLYISIVSSRIMQNLEIVVSEALFEQGLAKEDIGTTGPSLETHPGPEPGSVCLTEGNGQPWGRNRS